MTFGEIKLRIVKEFPGVDPDLLDGWVHDRYLRILDDLGYPDLSDTAEVETSSTVILDWVRPEAIIAGVAADICRSPRVRDYAGVKAHEEAFDRALKVMKETEASRMETTQFEVDPYYTDHRVRRWQR